MPQKTIRASEIGAYLYCRRAWWYCSQGFESQNQAIMQAGQSLHEQHGRQTSLTVGMRRLAFILLLCALILLGVYVFSLLV